MKYELTASLVAYKNPVEMLVKAIESFFNTDLEVKLFFIDHSPTDSLKKHVEKYKQLSYVHNPNNPGFGAGHNFALKIIEGDSPYHLFLNPDIYFDNGVNEHLIGKLNANSNIGIIMPRVTYPNGELQNLTRLLPRPIDYIVRRLVPVSFIKEMVNNRYEMKKFDSHKSFEVPFLSGCYMLVNMSVFKFFPGFDENYFMYCEDNDFCREVLEAGFVNWYCSDVTVVHDHERKSTLKWSTLKIFIESMFYYFNKWGWFFDKGRRKFNKKACQQIV